MIRYCAVVGTVMLLTLILSGAASAQPLLLEGGAVEGIALPREPTVAEEFAALLASETG